jgi:hypothetical protein
MDYSPKLTFVANGNNPIGVGYAPDETVCFGSLEFTTDHFGNMSLSPEGEYLGAIFVEMVHSGSPSLHTILEGCSDEGDAVSGGGDSSGFPGHVVTPTVPITITPPPKNTLVLLTISTTQLQFTSRQPGIELLLEQQQAY